MKVYYSHGNSPVVTWNLLIWFLNGSIFECHLNTGLVFEWSGWVIKWWFEYQTCPIRIFESALIRKSSLHLHFFINLSSQASIRLTTQAVSISCTIHAVKLGERQKLPRQWRKRKWRQIEARSNFREKSLGRPRCRAKKRHSTKSEVESTNVASHRLKWRRRRGKLVRFVETQKVLHMSKQPVTVQKSCLPRISIQWRSEYLL